MKNENNSFKEKLKKKQNEMESLLQDLKEKKELTKTNNEKLKSYSKSSNNICENSNLAKNDNTKYIQILKKSLKNTEPQENIITENNSLFDKRKTSLSTVSGSNRSGPNNSIKLNVDFNELLSDKLKNNTSSM